MTAAGTPLDLIKEVLQRLEQRRSRARDASAKDDGFRVEDVGERPDGARERADGFEPDARGLNVSGEMRGHEGVGAFEATAAALPDVVVADGGFKAAGHGANVGLSVHVEAGVAEMPALAESAGEEFPIVDDRAAHAGAERQHDDVAEVARGAEPRFADQRGVRVVEHGNDTRRV